jgi:hypothetical protein
LSDFIFEVLHILLEAAETGLQAGDLVLQVPDFHGELSLEHLQFIYLGINLLQFV